MCGRCAHIHIYILYNINKNKQTGSSLCLIVSCQVSHICNISNLCLMGVSWKSELMFYFMQQIPFPDPAAIDAQLRSILPGRGGSLAANADVWRLLPASDSIPSGVRNEPSPLQLSRQVIIYRLVMVEVVLLSVGCLRIWC